MLPRECRCAHLRQTSPAWRVAVVETTAPPSEMLRQAGHRLFWHTNWQFPVPTNYSLIRQRKFPDTKRTGNLPQALQIVMRFCVRHRQNDPKQIEFVKIPCYFPCCQGIHELLGDARTPQPGSRRGKGRHFFDESTLALAGPPARSCRGKDPTSPEDGEGKHHAGAPDFTSLYTMESIS